MSLKKGDRVRHPIKAEWGLGEVLADSNGEKVRIFFVGAGEKTISLKHVTLDCIPKDEAAHPVLDNLRVPAESGRIRYQSLSESIERFLERFPQGFYGDRFAAEERDYKVRAHQLAQDLLSKSELARLLSANECGEVCRRALRVSNVTNLIFPNEKMALKDGLESPAPKEHPREARPFWRRVRSVVARMRSVLEGVTAVGEPLLTGGVGCRGMLGTDLPLRSCDRGHRRAWKTLWEAGHDRRDPGPRL